MNSNCVRPISKAWINHLNEFQRNVGTVNELDLDIDERVKEEVKKEMAITDEDILGKIRDD